MRRLEVVCRGQVLFILAGEPALFESPAVQAAFFAAFWKAVANGPGVAVNAYDGEHGQNLR